MMTPRERFLTALRNGVPDRVPATPDLSNMRLPRYFLQLAGSGHIWPRTPLAP
jgi:hypothetical protein